jgi:hypothetical protein
VAEPDFDATTAQITLFNKQKKETILFTDDYAGRDDTLLAGLSGTFASGAERSIMADRAALASLLDGRRIREAHDQWMRQIGHAIATPNTKAGTLEQIWSDLYDYMHANTLTVESRNFTFGSVSAVTGTGNGTMIRCSVDERGYNLEGWWPDVYTATCESDGRIVGRLHKEQFVLRGRTQSFDTLNPTNSGLVTPPIQALSAEDSKRLVQNPSWNDYTSTAVAGAPAAPTALPGWTPTGSLSNLTIDLDITYRTTPGDSRSASLRFSTSDTITQDLTATKNAQFSPDVPYLVGIAVYRRDSCDRNIVLSLGAVSRTVAGTTWTNGTWTRIWLVATPGANNWLRGFNQNTMTLVITQSGGTTGTFHVDDLIVAPMTRVGAGTDTRFGRGSMGHYVAFVGGSTPFKKGDTFTFTDTENGGTIAGYHQHLFGRSFRGYLPSTTGTPTWSEPA